VVLPAHKALGLFIWVPAGCVACGAASHSRGVIALHGAWQHGIMPLMVGDRRNKSALVHGHVVNYVEAGEGPVLLLIHGIALDWKSWRAVVEPLAERHTVLAVDLPGHGASGAGSGDYSPGGMAAVLRDLLAMRGHERATVIGHSLGGGVAMQFTYQFPDVVERLVLVSSGGLGRELSARLRSGALPGAGPYLAMTNTLGLVGRRAMGPSAGARGRQAIHQAEMARAYASLADPSRRRAFLATLRFAVGVGGQRVSAIERLYLAQVLPVLIVWGRLDPIIPVGHAEVAHRGIPGSRLEVFEGVRHFPQLEEPDRFVAVLDDFLANTQPADFDREDWVARIKASQPQ
jgi:pimeloyl-ACP methyl ester carboxylesterase